MPDLLTSPSIKIKYSGIEICRIYSCYMIVWFHGANSISSVALSGLVVFLLLISFMAFDSMSRQPIKKVLQNRAKSLLYPWLFWSVLFITAKILFSHFLNEPLTSRLHLYYLFTGGSLHLWFLTYSYLMVCVCALFYKHTYSYFFIFCMFLSTLLAFAYSCFLHNLHIYPTPLPQILFSIPSFFIGFLLHYSYNFSILVHIYFISSFSLFLLFLYYYFPNDMIISYAIGILVFSILYYIKYSATETLITLGGLTYGIYIIHPLIYSFTKTIFKYCNITFFSFNNPFNSIIVFIISICLTYILKKSFIKSFL